MAQIITMPRLSDTMTEGVVATWLKKVGDTIKTGDILAEIETDKATMEFESFHDGVLLHIGIQEGQSAPVDSLLAIIGSAGEDISALLSGGTATETKEEKVVEEAKPKPDKRGGKRPGAGRPALVRLNKERIAQGLEPILPKQSINKKVKKQKSNAILPESKKARAQEVLAEMLGRKSKYIVQKVLDKALDDNDKEQMACLQLVMDRVLPKDYLSKVKGKSNQIQINISGVGQDVQIEGNEIEAEYEVEDE